MQGPAVIERVRSLVRCCFDRTAVLELLRSRPNHSLWEGQDEFVQQVLLDPVLKRFPVLPQYKARLLRAYLDDVTQNSEAEVHEDLLAAYLEVAHARASKTVQSLLPRDGNSAEEVFFTFELPNPPSLLPLLIPMKQRVEFTDVSQKMWPAAVVLGEYFLQNKVLSKRKREKQFSQPRKKKKKKECHEGEAYFGTWRWCWFYWDFVEPRWGMLIVDLVGLC